MSIPDEHSDRGGEVAAADTAAAFAPASIGNVAVGYDVLGCVFPAVADRVRVRRTETPGARVEAITGVVTDLPHDPVKNTATVALQCLLDERALPFGLSVTIEKGIPLGSGMGGSAASAVAAVKAANALLDVPFTMEDLFRYALAGEAVASGAQHGDNVAPSLFGGLVLTRALDPLDVVSVPVPSGIHCVLVRPHMQIQTRDARRIIPDTVPMATTVQHAANLAGLVAGCYREDLDLIRRAFDDVLIEPHRAGMIPGFRAVQAAARDAGALGCSIAGAGPSVFAWCPGAATASDVQAVMVEAFADAGLATDAWCAEIGAAGRV